MPQLSAAEPELEPRSVLSPAEARARQSEQPLAAELVLEQCWRRRVRKFALVRNTSCRSRWRIRSKSKKGLSVLSKRDGRHPRGLPSRPFFLNLRILI